MFSTQDLVLNTYTSRSVTDVVDPGESSEARPRSPAPLRAFGPLLPVDPSHV